jgi:hypothetical protein
LADGLPAFFIALPPAIDFKSLGVSNQTMTRALRTLTAVALGTSLVGFLLGPCLCGPKPTAAAHDHGCCGGPSGLRAATPECCLWTAPTQTALIGPDPRDVALAPGAPPNDAVWTLTPVPGAATFGRPCPFASSPPLFVIRI